MKLNPQNLTNGYKKGTRPKMIEIIGEDRLKSLIELQIQTAFHSPDPQLADSAQKFLIGKCAANPKPEEEGSYINFIINDIVKMRDVLSNELNILKKVGGGELSLEESDKLLSITEKVRKTFEIVELEKRMDDMNSRMIAKGI